MCVFIEANKCPGPYEEYILTDEGELTCDGSKPPPCLPITECRCISGFVRHEGVCIRKSECRKYDNKYKLLHNNEENWIYDVF